MPDPEFSLYDHQTAVALDLERLTVLARAAWPLVMARPGPEGGVLGELAEVEVSFITDEAIAEVHGRFLEDPTPTDVITFEHGEILISTETAVRQAADAGWEPRRETALYLVHGLLHLAGHEDATDEGFQRMKGLQESILDAVWPLAFPD